MIVLYTGPQGSGKTYWLTRDALRWLRRPGVLPECPCGREGCAGLVSNYAIRDPRTGRTSTVVDLTQGLRPLFDFIVEHAPPPVGPHEGVSGSFAAVQEIGQLMPARMWQSTTTFRVINELTQVRKCRAHLRADAQYLDLVDKLIRSNTHRAYECRVVFRHLWKRDEGAVWDVDERRVPRRPWLMRADGYRPKHLDLGEQGRKGRRVDRRMEWFSETTARAYDTYAVQAVRSDDEGRATAA